MEKLSFEEQKFFINRVFQSRKVNVFKKIDL
jgi:hypothetical protein